MRKKHTKDKNEDEPKPEQVVVIDRRPTYDADRTSADREPRYPSFVEELKARAEQAEQRAREISAAYRRIDEERDAFRERLSRELERRVDISRADLMRKMLGVADDLDRAISAARDTAESSPMHEGVVLTRDRLRQALASEGVEPFDTAGKPFDPNLAEAMAVEPTDDPSRDNLVLEELQQGYMLNGALLRPARVRVARLQASSSEPVEEGPATTTQESSPSEG